MLKCHRSLLALFLLFLVNGVQKSAYAGVLKQPSDDLEQALYDIRRSLVQASDNSSNPSSFNDIVSIAQAPVDLEDILCYNDTFFTFEDNFNTPGGLFGIFSTSATLYLCMFGGNCDFAGSPYMVNAQDNCNAANGRLVIGDVYVCASEFGVAATQENIRLTNFPVCVASSSCPSDITYQQLLKTTVDLGIQLPRFIGTLNGRCAPSQIEINWMVPSSGGYTDRTARVGDTVRFNYGQSHNVFLHPSGTCDETNSALVGDLGGPADYQFAPSDAGTTVTFACNIGSHCELGQIINFEVEARQGPPLTPTAPLPTPAPTLVPGSLPLQDVLCYNSTLFLLGDFNQPGGVFRFTSASETLTCFSGGNCNFAGSSYEMAAKNNCDAVNGRLVSSDLYICRSDFGQSPGEENVRLANMPICVDPITCPSDVTYQKLLQTAFDLGFGQQQQGGSLQKTLTGLCVPDVTEPPAPRMTMAPTPTSTMLAVDDFAAGIANGEYDVILDVRTRPEWIGGHIEGATFAESLGSFGDVGHTGATPTDLAGCESCTIAVYCRSGARAEDAIQVLLNNGFQGKLYNALGTIQWRNAGYQLVTTRVSVIPPCTTSGPNSCIAAAPAPVLPSTIAPLPTLTATPLPPPMVAPVPPPTVASPPTLTVAPVPSPTVAPVPPSTAAPLPRLTVAPVPPPTVGLVPPPTVAPVSPPTAAQLPTLTVGLVPPPTEIPVPPTTAAPQPTEASNSEDTASNSEDTASNSEATASSSRATASNSEATNSGDRKKQCWYYSWFLLSITTLL